MKKLFRFLAVFLLIGGILGVAGVLALTFYYRRHFPVNTWINGVYCTGKSIEQINEELINAHEASVIVIVDADSVSWEVNMQDADIRPDYTEALKAYLAQNASGNWMNNLHAPVSSELTAEKYSVDEGKLRECLAALPFAAEEAGREEGVRVLWSEEGYVLQDGNEHRLNLETVCAYTKDCLQKGQTTIELLTGGCYEDLQDSPADKAQRNLWQKIAEFNERSGRIIYDMGAEKISFTPDMAVRFLATDQDSLPFLNEQGEVTVKEELVRAWVEELALKYDTCNTEREFAATRGDMVTVKYVTYGTRLDVESETAYLFNALQTDTGTGVHVPAYLQEGYTRGLDDIGGTYIEIDMTEQKMYYYADRELMLETDIVTGNTGRRMGTPQGINFVYGKERNRTLRGPGYASFVKYWMPVKGNIGIHDASWRSKFGGQIYKTNGSHGCINTPSDIMAELYEMAEVGTPVIMFY